MSSKVDFGNLAASKKSGRDKVAGQFLVVAEGGTHVDLDPVVGTEQVLAVGFELAGEGLEAARMAAGDLGTDEPNLGIRSERVASPRSFLGLHFTLDRFGFGDIVGGILGAGNETEQDGEGEEMGDFHLFPRRPRDPCLTPRPKMSLRSLLLTLGLAASAQAAQPNLIFILRR